LTTKISLSYGQRRLWTLDKIEQNGATYNMPLAVRLHGPINIDALASALTYIIERHESLRTLITESEDGHPVGILTEAPSQQEPLIITDLSALQHASPEQCAEQVSRSIRQEAATPFNLATEIPFRAALIILSPLEHILMLTMHHHAGDGVSWSIIARELKLAYAAFNAGQTPQIPALPIQYSDWAHWQEAVLKKKLDAKLKRSKDRLVGIPDRLTLPADHPRHADRMHQAGYVHIKIPARTVQGLENLAKSTQTTFFAALLAAYGVMLSRIAGQATVVIGSPISGRTRTETEQIVGFFLNTLAIPVHTTPQSTARELFGQTKKQVESAIIDQDLPFELLVEDIGVTRSLDHTPIFQTMLSFQNQGDADFALTGTTSEKVPVGLATTKFDLTLALEPLASGDVSGVFEYDADLFQASNVQTWASCFVNLTEAMIASPDVPLLSLPMTDSTQRDNVIRESCGPLTELSAQPQNLPALFAAQLARTPDGCALLFEQSADQATDASMSFAELDAQSNQLARHLIATGIAADQIVAILLERSPQMIVAMLAVLKAGAAYLPLDPDLPASRLQFMLTDSQSQLLLTSNVRAQALQQGLASLTPHTAEPQNALPTLLDLTDPQVQHLLQALPTQEISAQERPQPLLPEHLAYLIYTSGSTGTPKGAGNTHHAVVNRLLWMQDTMRLGTQDRVLQKTAIGFDVAVWEWFLPLMTGAALVIARPEGQKDPAYLKSVIEQHRVSVLHFVPSMLAVFLEALESHQCNTIRQIVTSGEALSGAVQAQTFARLPHTRLWNLYGPTEAAIDVSVWSCSAQDGAQTPPIGHPIWNTQLYILDAMLEPLPYGVMGELYIAGTGLARGYLGRSGLTAERFIACPLGLPGARMYRTGDLARRRADGAIEYLGRADDQVKVRGYRIELGEIEAAFLAQDTTLAQVAVITRMIQGDQRLVAYLVARAGQPAPDTDRLRATLLSTLPEYMVPAYFVTIDALPLSANGKLDRRALPEPAIQSSTQDYRAPRNHAETLLCNLFAEITGAEQVGIDDGFFALGGDSISAIRLVSRVRAAGYIINVRDIFKNQSPAGLADVLKDVVSTLADEVWVEEGSIPALPIYLEYLSANQSIDRFNQTVCLQAPEHVSHAQVSKALGALVKHHGALRLRTVGQGIETQFIIDPIDQAPAPVIAILDLTQQEPAQAEQTLVRAIDELSTKLSPQQPGAMIAALWVNRNELPSLLVLTLHHFVVDGVSWRILLDDLKRLTTDAMASLPARTMSLRAWAQALALEGELGARRAEEGLWLSQVENTDALPQDHLIDARNNTYQTIATTKGQLSIVQTEQLTRAQATYHGAVNDVLLAALGLALRQWSLRQYRYDLGDTVIALEGHGRETDADLSRTVGWLTSMFPIRLEFGDLNLNDLASAGHAVRRVKERLRAMPDKGLGYGILRYLDPESRIAQIEEIAPQLVFNYLGRLDKKQDAVDQWQLAEGFASTSQDDPLRQRLHLIEINALIHSDGSLRFDIHYCGAAYANESIEELARCFETMLQTVSQHCLEAPFENRHTPSDYPLVTHKIEQLPVLDQSVLDQLMQQYPDLQDIVPLTPSQQGLAFESMARAEGLEDPYHIQIILIVKGKLDIGAMQRAWARVIKRHAILRLVLAPSDIAPGLAVIRGDAACDDQVVELTGSYEQRLAQIQSMDLKEGFDFGHQPLVRLRIGDLGEQKSAILISKHHLILDGWSLPILMRELAHIYDCDVKGLTEKLSRPFAWQDHLQWLARQDQHAARQYWLSHLNELTEPSRLQFIPPAVEQTGTGAVYFNFDQSLNEQFDQFARTNSLTQASVLMGLFGLVLARTSRLSEIVIGSVHNGRSNTVSGIDQAVGLFIDTLPLFMHLPAGEPLAQWLRHQQTAQSEQDVHSHIGLAAIQTLAGFPGTSIFEALFVFENFPTDASTIPVGDLTVLESLGHDGTNYPLALGAIPGKTLSLRLTFDRARMDASHAQQFMDRLTGLIRALPRIGETPLAAIRLTDALERQALIEQSAGTELPTDDSALNIPQLFEMQVTRQSEAFALLFKENGSIAHLTYAELDARANQMARHLITEGVGPGEIIALLLERSEELVVATLAVLKTGAAYLPLDPAYPATRLEFILQDSQVQRVISHESIYDTLQSSIDTTLPELLDFEDPILNIRLSFQSESAVTDADRTTALLPETLAYLIYTSGSTGQPKAVGISHAAAVNLARAQLNTFGLNSADRVLQFASQAFDASVWEMLLAFGSGAALVIPDTTTRTDAAADLSENIQSFGITHATLPPALVAALDTEVLGSLNTLVVAGEACSPEIVSRFARNRRMFNAYGPTEATVCATISPALEAQTDGAAGSGPVTIGHPLANMQVYLLDSALEPVPEGMQGELYIAGSGLARGYIGRSGLTAERFIACPFSKSGERMYRSGDIARRRPDGSIEFLGRSDDQVKIHGYRIELGEIESALLKQSDSLLQVAVIARDFGTDQRLVAYMVVHAEHEEPDAETLSRGLSALVPDYMVPNYFISIAALPFTPNGKLDRRALPAPTVNASQTDRIAPRSTEETVLCGIFESLTNQDHVGVTDGFFSIGGDSISVIRLVSLARAQGLSFTVRDVFTYQTPEAIAAISQKVIQAETTAAWAQDGPIPALPVFRAFWKVEGSLDRFNQAILLDAPEQIGFQSIKTALETLRAHHGGLRLRCEGLGEHSQLTVDPVGDLPPVKIFELDLSGLEPTLARATLVERFSSLSAHLAPSQQGGMMVALWITCTDGSHQLALVIHHYAVDGVSWRVLIDDIQTLTQPGNQGLATPTMSLRAWAELLEQQGQDGVRRSEEAFWLEQIRDCAALPVAREYRPEKNTLEASENYHCTLNEQDTKRLVAAASVYHGGINDIFLAALGFAVSQWAESNFQISLGDPVIDLEGHGREMDADLTRTVGWLTTVFPVKLNVGDLHAGDADNLGVAVRRIKEVLRAMPDKGLGFGILKFLDPNSQLASIQETTAQIGFNYLGRFEQSQVTAQLWKMAEGGLIAAQDEPTRKRMHLLDINTAINPTGTLDISITYCKDAHNANEICDLALRFEQFLIQVSAHCLETPLLNKRTYSDFTLLQQNPLQAEPIEQSVLDTLAIDYPDFEDIVQLTPLQQGLAFESMTLEEGVADPYHVHLLLTFTGKLDSGAMQRAWHALAKRHMVMRLIVAPASLPTGLGIVLNENTIEYERVALSENTTDPLDTLKAMDFARPFALNHGPLIRLYEADLGPNEWAILISNHHLILDGWSLPILTGELAELYQAECDGRSAVFDKPFEWKTHLNWLNHQDLNGARDYWQHYLSELTTPSRLDLPAPLSIRAGMKNIEIALGASTTRSLDHFSREHGLTQASVLQALFALVLARRSKLNDIVIGSVRNGRSSPLAGIDRGVGLFINTLPMYTTLAPGMGLVQWIREQQVAMADQDTHGHIGLREIQQIAGMGGTALFEAMFVFENYPVDKSATTIGQLTLKDAKSEDGNHYPIGLSALTGEILTLRLGFDQSRLDEHNAKQILDQLIKLVTHLPEIAGMALAEIPMIDEAERTTLIKRGAGQDIPGNPSVHSIMDLIDQQIKLTPDAIALVCGNDLSDASMTFAELDARANQLARYLIECKVGPDDVVGIMLERTPELLIALLGTMRAGAAYLPLATDYPAQRLAFMLSDSQAKQLISTARIFDAFQSGASVDLPAMIDLESASTRQKINQYSTSAVTDQERVAELLPTNLAYLIYTSGSTGLPKGVALSHHGMLNYINWAIATYDLASGNGAPINTSIAFDATITSLWLPLTTGRTIHFLDQENEIEALAEKLQNDNNFSLVKLTPVHLDALRHLLPASTLAGQTNSYVIGGEQLTAATVEFWRTNAPATRLINEYGPTETVVGCCVYEVSDQTSHNGVIPIGKPIWNTQLYLLDPHLELVSDGTVGELYIGGEGLARGYLGRTGLTSERFIACTFSKTGARMYRTGDLARRREDGVLIYLGRVDDQVKIRGYRIELGEIETALLNNIDNLAHAAVIAKNIAGELRLVAYLVPNAGQTVPDYSYIKNKLSEFLPDHMVPGLFVTLDTLPLTPNGKLDRSKLPDTALNQSDTVYIAPNNQRESIFCDLFATLTGIERAGLNDSFFALGGDSILSIRLVSRARAEGLIISVKDIFKYQTPSELATVARLVNDSSIDTIWVENGEFSVLPIYREFLNAGGPLNRFNQTACLRVPDGVSIESTSRALKELVAHHAALRMRTKTQSNATHFFIDPVSQVAPTAITVLDLTEQASERTELAITDAMDDLSSRLSPERGVMVAALWVIRKDQPPMLILTIHHFAVDGVSWRILIEDLSLLTQTPGAKLPSQTMSLLAWGAHLSEQGMLGARRSEEAIWHHQLSDIRVLPQTQSDTPIQNTLANSAIVTGQLNIEETQQLLRAPSVYFGSINDVLLASLGLTLARWSQIQYGYNLGDPVVMLEGHGREGDVDLSRSVGWFTSAFPVRLEVNDLTQDDSSLSSGRAIQRIKENLRALPDKGIGYGILRHLDPTSTLYVDAPQQPQILFNYLGRFESSTGHQDQWTLTERGLTSSKDAQERPRLQLLEMNAMIDQAGAFVFNIAYCKSAHEADSILQLARLFEATLQRVTHDCLHAPLEIRHTPSDFALLMPEIASEKPLIDQEQLATLLLTYPDLEDLVPLTALQQGLAYESMSLEDNVYDPYHVQLILTLSGEINSKAMQSAWTLLTSRHSILRLALAPAGIAPGVGIIRKTAGMGFETLNLSGTPESRLDTLKKYDQDHPFVFETGPLVRIYLSELDHNKHALLLSNHHLVLDGWSGALLGNELAKLYDAQRLGLTATLDKPFPWQDHLKWIAARDKTSARSYWKKHLEGLTSPSRLDFPAPVSPVSGMGELHSNLDSQTTEAINQFSRELMVTQATVFQGLFALLLAKMNGMQDIILGSVRHGRSSLLPGIENALGLFINTLPIYLKLEPGLLFADWLRAQQAELMEQETHDHIGLAEIQSLAGITSESLFDALFVFENYPVNSVSQGAGDLVVSSAQGLDGNHYPLALSVVPGPSILLRLTFDLQKIDHQLATELMERLEQMIKQLPAQISTAIAEIPYTSAQERNVILAQSAGESVVNHRTTLTLTELLSIQASQTPDTTALCFEQAGKACQFTYAELDAKSNQLARYLIEQGIGPDDIVAIMLDRSPEMILSILAILKTGAAYLPLDAAYPATRLHFMVTDSKTHHLISTTSAAYEVLGQPVTERLNLIDVSDRSLTDRLCAYSDRTITDAERTRPLLPANIVYLIYTSGSTGRPKGVGFLHGSLSNLILWQESTSPNLPRCVLQYSPISFDASAQEIVATLTRGGTLVLMREEDRKDGLAMLEYIAKQKIDLLHVPYVVLSNIAQARRNYDLDTWPAEIITAGEQLQITPEIRQAYLKHPGAILQNHYGPTETHVVSSYVLNSHPDEWSEFPSIGKAIWNTQLYVLDASLQLVPDGVVGELYIAGDSLARGYLNRAAMTSERFIADPFGMPGSRMYRTGDLVRRGITGDIDYIGRVDDQVKLRGFRIELGEVEAAVLKYIPGVNQVAVIARPLNGNKRLVAYLVADAMQQIPDLSTLRALLLQYLPDYMVPGHYIEIPSLPLTPNGKLDRRALPEPVSVSSLNRYTAPRSAREAYLCKLFSSLTETDPVGIDDSFFDIGGHSLLAMQLVSRLRIELGIKLNLRVLFANPSPRLLASNLESSSNWIYDPLLPLRKTGSQLPIFCIHPGGGSGTVYQNVTDALPADYPVWALQARGLEENEEPHHNVVEMAADYIQAIRKIQPEGPYQLLGWSFGGTIAQEMAVQLEAMSQSIRMLVLLDTVAKPELIDDNRLSDEAQSKLILESAAQSLGITDEIIDLNNEDFMLKLIQKMSEHRLMPESTPIEAFKRTITQMISATKLTASHRIKPCNAPIIFVRAAQEPLPEDPSMFDWSVHTSGTLKNFSVDARHSAMWEKQPSREIADILLSQLTSVQSEAGDTNTMMDSKA